MPDVTIDLQNEIISLREQLANATTQLEAQTISNTELLARVAQLQEHNQQLFLRVTADVKTDPVEQPEQSIEDFANSLEL